MSHKPGCTGKKHFAKFGQAATVAKRRNRCDGGAHLEAYHCRFCNGFHVGEARSYGQRKPKSEAPA
jgi:hypothetical protein